MRHKFKVGDRVKLKNDLYNKYEITDLLLFHVLPPSDIPGYIIQDISIIKSDKSNFFKKILNRFIKKKKEYSFSFLMEDKFISENNLEFDNEYYRELKLNKILNG